MKSFKNIIRQPFKVGTLDINVLVDSLNGKRDEVDIIGLNQSQRNFVIANYFNDIIYNRKMVGSIFVTKSNQIFSDDGCLLHLALNFAGKKNDVYYDLKEKVFVKASKQDENVPLHYITPYNLFSPKYFFSKYQAWIESGVTEEDLDIAGDIAGRIQQTLIRTFTNSEMDDAEFIENFMK